jgi:meiotic recombination protein SPO11
MWVCQENLNLDDFSSTLSRKHFILRVCSSLIPRTSSLLPMDFDLLFTFLDHKDVDSSEHLLSNLQNRGRLTHQQTDKNIIALENEELIGRDMAIMAMNRNQAGAVITKIEDIFESVVDCVLDEEKELVIPMKSRGKSKNIVNKDNSTRVNRTPKTETRNICFPSRSPQEAWKFSELTGFDF